MRGVVLGLALCFSSSFPSRARAEQPATDERGWIKSCLGALRDARDLVRQRAPKLGKGELSYTLDERRGSERAPREGKVRYVGKRGRLRYDAFLFTGGGAHPLGATWKQLDTPPDRWSRMLQGANQSEAWISVDGATREEFEVFEAAFRPALDRCFELRPR